jgi:hypothetical protein
MRVSATAWELALEQPAAPQWALDSSAQMGAEIRCERAAPGHAERAQPTLKMLVIATPGLALGGAAG